MSCKICGESRYYSPQTGCYVCHSRESDAKVERASKLYDYLEQPDVLMSLPQPHRLAISELLHGDSEAAPRKQSAFSKRSADRLAYAVAKCVERGSLGSRSGPADALLDYLSIGQTDGYKSVPEWVAEYEAKSQ